MLLYESTYTNIGPFVNQTFTVCFKHGKYLITAPIGTGKSFLFFDGPVYALYKYATRNMLSNGSKTGSITLHFSINNEHFLIKRSLKKGKKESSCTSRLRKMEEKKQNKISMSENYFDSIILPNVDIFQKLGEYYDFEEIVFKNEKDLQKQLNQFLPPKEVFLATYILLQDAENIFMQQPSERLEVFKHIFNLLDIDAGKEILSEKRKELQTKITVLGDTSHADKKLHSILEAIKKQTEILIQETTKTKHIIDFDSKQCPSLEKLNEDRTIFGTKLTISGFETNVDFGPLTNLLEKIQNERQKAQEISSKITHKRELLKQFSNELQTAQNEKEKLIKQIETVKTTIQYSPIDLINAKKQERTFIIQQQQNLLGEIPPHTKEIIQQEIIQKKQKDLSEISDFSNAVELIPLRYEICQQTITEGKTTNLEIEACDANIKRLTGIKEVIEQQIQDLDYTKTTSTAKKELTQAIKNKQAERTKEIEQLQKELYNGDEIQVQQQQQITLKHTHLERLITKIQEQTNFQCDKINTVCPYVKIINKKTLDELEHQRDLLEQEIKEIEKKIKENNRQTKKTQLLEVIKQLEKNIQNIDLQPEIYLQDFFETIEAKRKKILQEYTPETINNELREIGKTKENLSKKREQLRMMLQKLEYKTCEIIYKKRQELEKQRLLLEQEIENHTTKLLEIEQSKQQLALLQGKLETLQQTIVDIGTKKNNIEKEITDLLSILDTFPIESRNKQEQIVTTILKLSDQLIQLIDEQKNKQLVIKQTKEQYEIVSNLYTIFSKELLLLVLQESVPILQDIMNAYLNQVVNYTILMEIKQEDDKIALDITINDMYGKRDIKSLSGGQKVILKLVRMLSVASYMRTSMLFLDETINNLDYEAVGKVADMLTDFVRQHNIKLYVVTHNEQIKEMGIWDEVIQLDVALAKMENLTLKKKL